MSISGLDHFSIATDNEEKCAAFYCDLLGLTRGARPNLSFPGMWLYAGDWPVLHVIFEKDYPRTGTGSFHHIALKAEGDPKVLEDKLTAAGISFESRMIERTSTYQIFFKDPDNLGVELNFKDASAFKAA